MGAIVTFDFKLWALRFPEFASVNPALAQEYFNEATDFLRNDGGGPTNNADLQLRLLNLITAHIAKLNAIINGVAPSDLVGPITHASEGSVSVGVDVGSLPGSAAWFNQTKYGIQAWAAMRGFRTGHYRSYRRPIPSGGAFGGGGFR